MEKGLLIVVSGPAGSGKGTVNAELLKDSDYVFSVSATSRNPRNGEINGKNYYFISREDFERKIANGEMLEHTEYCGNYYGTPKAEVERAISAGKNLILEIEVDGAGHVKEIYPDAVLIMLLPTSFKLQEERLRARNTETEQSIKARLARAHEELELLDMYDYIVYNHQGAVAESVENIKAIVKAEKLSRKRNPDAAKKYFTINI